MKGGYFCSKAIVAEVLTRTVLVVLHLVLGFAEPFHRKIQADEEWLYKYPRTQSYVPTPYLWIIVFAIPTAIILTAYLYSKDRGDLIQAVLAFSLAFGLNGVATNIIKVTVGRPRPDFFYRCFPNGVGSLAMPCTGRQEDVVEGLKSFPSGHSSFAFTSLGFTALYLCGKLGTFQGPKRQQSWRLLLPSCLLLSAVVVAISRTCDYHHHWQDVLAGSTLGLSVAWLCYRQYYPSLSHPYCAKPYTQIPCTNRDDLEDASVKWI